MTASQRFHLLANDIAWWLGAILLLGIPAVAIELGPSFLDFLKDVKVILLSAYSIGIGSWALYRAAFIGADVLRGRLLNAMTHLPVSTSMIEEHRTYKSFLSDTGVKLRFPKSSFQRLRMNDLYRVYFTPFSRRLVSFERIGTDYGALPPLA